MRRYIPDPQPAGRQGDFADTTISQRLAFWLGRISTGETRQAGAIELTPLLHDGPHGEPFVLLHDALASGVLEISEQGEARVNSVQARNRGQKPVLILEGESIVGAKQNRVVTLDAIVAAGETLAIPVGCVERGRWRDVSASFRSADLPLEPKMRSKTIREMIAVGHVNQARLWADIDEKLASHEVRSPSSDYHDYVAKRASAGEVHMPDLRPEPNQVGVLARLDGQLLGMDVVGCPANWASLAQRLVKTYILAGLDAPAHAGAGGGVVAGGSSPAASAQEWLRRVATANVRVRPGLGRGIQLGLLGDGLRGGGLWWEGSVAHLAAFGE